VILFGNIFPMKNKLSKLVYDSISSKIEIVDDTACNNFRKSNER
jgi:hypothetical protein